MPRKKFQSRKETPWDDMSSKTPTQELLTNQFKSTYDRKHPVLNTTAENVLINSFVPDCCPFCGVIHIVKKGMTSNGVQRYKCYGCGKSFTPVSGTIFDGHKISITEWTEYLLNIFRYVSLNAGSWNNRNAFTTSRYWLEKLFLVLEDQNSGVVLSGDVWLDETYYSVRTSDIVKTASGKKLRGISQNQLCIGVACTKSRIICILEGTGRPSKMKTYNAFHSHIEPGSTLIHDKDKAHSLLISRLGLKDQWYDSKVIKALPDKENPLNRVNQVHARLKDFLNAHSSFNRDSLQGYLNVFSFAMNPPRGYLEKVDALLNLTFKVHKTLRYRDFYS